MSRIDDLDAVFAADDVLLGRQAAFAPVAPLHVVARAQLPEDGLGVDLVDVHVVDVADRVDDRRALRFGQQRPMLGADVAIGRDVAQHRRAQLARRLEVLDVTVVQRVERPVDHGHLAAVARLAAARRSRADHEPSDQQPLLLQLVERLVEEVGGDVRRRLRPFDQLGEPVVERHLRRESQQRLRAA